jgi:diaminohydroxyphosphoribosylaminopyrimidine deaminase/5-amino-6-(5-phosphoribosylamino)uracil reductase
VDEIVLYMAPLILGDTAQSLFVLPEIASLDAALRPHIVDVRAIGPDVRITARF